MRVNLHRKLAVLLIVFALCNVQSFGRETWFSQRVTWSYGKEGSPWTATISSPDRKTHYLLTLRPLWAVEGGVIALEIVLAKPSRPDVNILGQRARGVESPFVITVGDLQKGLARTKFGTQRTFQVDDILLDVKVGRFHLGKGVGSLSTYCADCKNLRELSMWVTIESRSSAHLSAHSGQY